MQSELQYMAEEYPEYGMSSLIEKALHRPADLLVIGVVVFGLHDHHHHCICIPEGFHSSCHGSSQVCGDLIVW